MTDNAKQKGLHGQKRYYYVFSLGTEHDQRRQGECSYCGLFRSVSPPFTSIANLLPGLAKQIMQYHQNVARGEDLPIWLEATTSGSRHLYLSLGFEEIEEIVLGKGKVAADASIEPGGPGVSLWAMVWWPEGSKHAPRL